MVVLIADAAPAAQWVAEALGEACQCLPAHSCSDVYGQLTSGVDVVVVNVEFEAGCVFELVRRCHAMTDALPPSIVCTVHSVLSFIDRTRLKALGITEIVPCPLDANDRKKARAQARLRAAVGRAGAGRTPTEMLVGSPA